MDKTTEELSRPKPASTGAGVHHGNRRNAKDDHLPIIQWALLCEVELISFKQISIRLALCQNNTAKLE